MIAHYEYNITLDKVARRDREELVAAQNVAARRNHHEEQSENFLVVLQLVEFNERVDEGIETYASDYILLRTLSRWRLLAILNHHRHCVQPHRHDGFS